MTLRQALFSPQRQPVSQRWRLPCRPSLPRSSRQRPRSTTTTSAASLRGPNGPEAGVWVIAETTELPTKFAKMRRHRRSGPLRHPRPAEGELPGLGARLWAGRFAEGARQAGPSSSISRRCRRRTSAAAAQYYPAIYWYAMMKIPPAKDFGGTTDIPKNITQRDLAPADEQRRLHRLPSARPGIDAHHPGAVRRVQVRRGSMDAPHRRPASPAR